MYGNGHWGWIQILIDLGLGKMICIYIYICISHHHPYEDIHRQGTTSNQKTEPMPAGELEGSIPGFCSSAVLHGLETGFERQNQCCL